MGLKIKKRLSTKFSQIIAQISKRMWLGYILFGALMAFVTAPLGLAFISYPLIAFLSVYLPTKLIRTHNNTRSRFDKILLSFTNFFLLFLGYGIAWLLFPSQMSALASRPAEISISIALISIYALLAWLCIYFLIRKTRASFKKSNFLAIGRTPNNLLLGYSGGTQLIPRPSLFLKRFWPLQTHMDKLTFIGGEPYLPSHIEWPRSRTNQPLHFVAQIDCAEVHSNLINARLPKDGILLFFANIYSGLSSYEADSEAARRACKVIYLPDHDVPTISKPAPQDIPYINHIAGDISGPYAREIKAFAKWPVSLHKVDTYMLPETDPKSQKSYIASAQYELNKNIQPLLSTAIKSSNNLLPLVTENADQTLIFNQHAFDAGFPYLGQVITEALEFTASKIAHQIEATNNRLNALSNHLQSENVKNIDLKENRRDLILEELEQLEIVKNDTQELQLKVRDLEPYTRPSDEERTLFTAWYCDHYHYLQSPQNSIEGIIQRAAYDAHVDNVIAEKVAVSFVQNYERDFQLSPKNSHHFVLGNANPQPQNNQECLLCIESDPAIGLIFSDNQALEFWIFHSDLGKHAFENAYCTLRSKTLT